MGIHSPEPVSPRGFLLLPSFCAARAGIGAAKILLHFVGGIVRKRCAGPAVLKGLRFLGVIALFGWIAYSRPDHLPDLVNGGVGHVEQGKD